MMAIRIQRQRLPGWRMPAGAVYVGRPTKWGNPWRIGQLAECAVRRDEIEWLPNGVLMAQGQHGIPLRNFDGPLTADKMLSMYRAHILETIGERRIRDELRGKTLACWCRRDAPCHGDVLLAIANGETA